MPAAAPTPHADAPAAIPRGGLGALILPVEALTPECSVQQAGERFLEARHAELLSLPVVHRGRPLGVVSRHELMVKVYMQPYGRELHGRRPVTTLMNAAPLLIGADADVKSAGALIGARLRRPITEDFLVVDAQGCYVGVGIVLDVLRALEDRLGQRSDELEQAYRRLQASQHQLVQSEKLATLGQLVAGLAHEINTPLGYVRNNVEMTRASLPGVGTLLDAYAGVVDGLLGGVDEAEFAARAARLDSARDALDPAMLGELESLLDDTLHGVKQIGELVGNLKDYSRLDTRRTEAVDLHGLIDSALRIGAHLLKKKAIVVDRRYGALQPVRCAPAQINQVLLNLIANAAQAIEHGAGRITLRTQCLGGYAMVAVEDNGKGIPADVLPRIFEPFFTTKPVGQGTGLGLSICQQIVQAHGGRIGASSTPGVGTRFVLALPLAAAPPEARA